MLALGVVNYLLFFGEGPRVAPPTLEERLETPASEAPGPRGGAGDEGESAPSVPGVEHDGAVDDFGEPIGREIAGELKRGQTILKSLRRQGIDSRTAMPLIHAMERVFDFRHAQAGDDFRAWLDDEGQIRRFRYVQSPLDVYEVNLEEPGRYAARKVKVPTEVEVAGLGCAIENSLYGSIARCGEGPRLGTSFIDLFAWDVDFFQDVRQGDVMRVLVEKVSVDGRFLKYGKIVAAEYDGKFGRHRIVHYTDPAGNSGYFTEDGRAVRKDFLKSPLKYTRVSARGASGIRRHLKKASPVVYTASEDTPVWAVASGTVAFAGESGSLGTTVTIQHEGGYTSTYGHLGDKGEHIEVGALVNQKTVIGHVGTSGQADEPKLLFSLRKNGRLVDPLDMKFSEADPVPRAYREHFEHEVEELLRDLESMPVVGIHERRS